jgi:polyketide biosynthesis enoyl-CoA hydratase PksI
MYADVVLLARESLYGTNFMKYGFTPGMGATLIIPEKFGRNLASEMLFSAKSYHGGELKERGVPFTVVPKAEVISQAMALAKELADKPRGSLMLLKNKLRQPILKQLQETITEEVRMHDISFAQPEVRQRIEVMFGN